MTPALGILLLWAWTKLTGKAAPRATGFVPEERTSDPAALKAAAKAPLTVNPAAPKEAAKKAQAASKKAVATKAPADVRAALAHTQKSLNKAAQQAQEIKAATKAAAPWPAPKPPDLPPFPAGWEPDTPPPPAVVTRAWQLLPVLWKLGKGSKKVETIKGRWITFVAADHGGGKKGVTAFRVKPGAVHGHPAC